MSSVEASPLPTPEEDGEMLSAEDLQYAALSAKLREWNLTYTVEREFPITDVQREAAAQVREASHIAPALRVEEYAQQMRNGAMFPPILLRTPGNVLVDGNTRLGAAKRIGRKTFPAVIVDTKTAAMAKILAAAINQMGGERLTAGEAHEAALLMMREGYPDPAVARELGRDLSQVRRWRNQHDVEERARGLGLADSVGQIPRNTLGTVAPVMHDEPFAELVKLFADVRPPEKQAREYVSQVVQAPSDEAAVAKVAELREELAPAGPPPHTATRSAVPLVRAAIGNLMKLRGRVDAGFNPAKREEELKRWEELKSVVDEMLAALRNEDKLL
jgi:ParB-like chromosome segregation protein Spo0J